MVIEAVAYTHVHGMAGLFSPSLFLGNIGISLSRDRAKCPECLQSFYSYPMSELVASKTLEGSYFIKVLLAVGYRGCFRKLEGSNSALCRKRDENGVYVPW